MRRPAIGAARLGAGDVCDEEFSKARPFALASCSDEDGGIRHSDGGELFHADRGNELNRIHVFVTVSMTPQPSR
jgi:hypothetical protein